MSVYHNGGTYLSLAPAFAKRFEMHICLVCHSPDSNATVQGIDRPRFLLASRAQVLYLCSLYVLIEPLVVDLQRTKLYLPAKSKLFHAV